MFAERRQKLRAAMGPGAVAVFLGHSLVRRSNDTDYPFRQDSDLWYLSGFAHPNAVVVLRTDGGPPYTLYVEARDPKLEIWNGYRPGVEGALADYGADAAFEQAKFIEHLPELVEKAERFYHVLGRNPRIDERIHATNEELRRRSRQGVAPLDAIHDPRSLLHEMRLVKDASEIDAMRRAAAISATAHREAARAAQPGAREYEVQAALEFAFQRHGGRPAYTTIVGGGANATVLHYVSNDRELCAGEVVLVDAGCEFGHYAADLTRSYPIGGRFGAAQRAVYEVVLAAQCAALAECRPGSDLTRIHDAAVRVLTQGMIDLGLLKGDVAELIRSEAYKRYYMHGTSHWLGLDVHDVGSYRQGGKPRLLEPGMVLTVEPGLYVGARDVDAPEALRGIGVRIEDDVLITADGHENLTAAVPKEPAELEALVSGR